MKTVALLLLFALSAHAATPWRKILAISACAVSAYDGYQTANMPRGVREGNGFLANPNGTPRLGAMIGWKAGLCAAPFIMAHTPLRPAATPLAGVDAAVSAGVVIHNQQVRREVSK